ncbi:MAG: phosphoglyceromutase [Chitinophagaceae bacterium]|nr:MAG: phosphoglyceromutase [Chitinophagaceae bacterium]
MKYLLVLFALSYSTWNFAQTSQQNIIIITTDGLRWQEVFKGMDTSIANNSKFNQGDSTYIYKNYWAASDEERRKKLMPFFWSRISKEGIIYGNRVANNKVDVANRYWFSYPGYNEIMTGFPDTLVNSNAYKPNPHVTVLEFLNHQPALKGKVAAFGAWNAFDRILNEKRSGIPVVNGFDDCGGVNPTEKERLINEMRRNGHKPWLDDECLDVFTHYAAFEHLKSRRPRVLYISYGETDEWAHGGQYRNYLDAARQVDEWIKDIWTWVQTDPRYAGKTSLLFTVDHGRGDLKKEQWTDHGSDVVGASQIFIGAIGPNIKMEGEVKKEQQLFQMQLAQTIVRIMGYTYKADHPIAGAMLDMFRK